MSKSMKTTGFAAILGLAAGLMAAPVPASAGDFLAGPSDGRSPWMVRVRGLAVIPDEDANTSVAGGDVSIDNQVVPEVDFTYFLDDHFALELILATTNHDVRGKGTLAGANLGDVWLLPPTLTLQYHFNITDQIKPYVGAGVNYTIFYGVDDGAFVDIEYDDSFGVALQAGVDIAIDDHWGVNFDVKKLFLNTDVKVNTGAGIIRADVDIDPWIIGAGISYRF